jgi:hypothetical protein
MLMTAIAIFKGGEEHDYETLVLLGSLALLGMFVA